MRICVPSAGSGGLKDGVGEHFGRVPTYTILDSETEEYEVIDNESEHRGGSGLPADLLADAGVDVVVCSGLGRKAINLLGQHGVEVNTGVSGTVQQAVNQWKRDELSSASEADACSRHKYGDRNHKRRL